MLQMSVYNLSGSGAGGYHYDPLVMSSVVAVVAEDGGELVGRRRSA